MSLARLVDRIHVGHLALDIFKTRRSSGPDTLNLSTAIITGDAFTDYDVEGNCGDELGFEEPVVVGHPLLSGTASAATI